MNYYNEFNPESAAMLRSMIADGIIPNGYVDERSITEVQPDELIQYTQCHFFAGIGGWPIALRIAGYHNTPGIWTGSCPCQPFSSAGRQKGKDDDRHLWPVWERLVRERRPAKIFGEQVASAIAHGWLDDVYQGLEPKGYAIAAAVLPAASVGAPHKRDRLWFVANASQQRIRTEECPEVAGTQGTPQEREEKREWLRTDVEQSGSSSLDHSFQSRLEGHTRDDSRAQGWQEPQRSTSEAVRRSTMADSDSDSDSASSKRRNSAEMRGLPETECQPEHSSAVSGGDRDSSNWSTGEWINCPDGKARLIEPGIRLLADGVSHRRPIPHAFGNAIVPVLAAEFIKASY